jgi:uncharacterized membrane protein YeaQ/YmgE (transglycosylase-associated protein family)
VLATVQTSYTRGGTVVASEKHSGLKGLVPAIVFGICSGAVIGVVAPAFLGLKKLSPLAVFIVMTLGTFIFFCIYRAHPGAHSRKKNFR